MMPKEFREDLEILRASLLSRLRPAMWRVRAEQEHWSDEEIAKKVIVLFSQFMEIPDDINMDYLPFN